MKTTKAIQIPTVSVDNHGIRRTLHDIQGDYLHVLHYSEEVFFLAHHMMKLGDDPKSQIRGGWYDRTLDEKEFDFFIRKYKHVLGRVRKNPAAVEDWLDEALEELKSPYADFWNYLPPNSELILRFTALSQVAYNMICYQRSLTFIKAKHEYYKP